MVSEAKSRAQRARASIYWRCSSANREKQSWSCNFSGARGHIMNARNAVTHLQDDWNVWGTYGFFSAIGHERGTFSASSREHVGRKLEAIRRPPVPLHRVARSRARQERHVGHISRGWPLPFFRSPSLNPELPKTCNWGDALVKKDESLLNL